jgi:uncharacterized protein HemY
MMDAAISDPGPTNVWFETALVCLRLGDRAGHKALCAAMCRAMGERPLGARLETALTCVLAADGVDDWQAVRRWCEEGNANQVTNISLLLGAVLYRQGLFEKAQAPLREAATGAQKTSAVAAHLFLAMAIHRTGQEKPGAEALEQARRTLKRIQASGLGWTDQVLLGLLQDEAEELCRPKE